MGGIILGLGLAAWAVKQFGEKEMVERHGDRLLIVGFLLISVGVGLLATGEATCGQSWGTHGSESDC